MAMAENNKQFLTQNYIEFKVGMIVGIVLVVVFLVMSSVFLVLTYMRIADTLKMLTIF